MFSKRSAEGYLMSDHRASPGLSADLVRALGLEGNLGEGKLWETPTMTCCHCGGVVVLNPLRTRARGYCPKCDAYHCDGYKCSTECTPHLKTLDTAAEQLILNPNFPLTKG